MGMKDVGGTSLSAQKPSVSCEDENLRWKIQQSVQQQ